MTSDNKNKYANYAGYVYFIQFNVFSSFVGKFKLYKQFMKIGFSRNLVERFKIHSTRYGKFKLLYIEYCEQPRIKENHYHRLFKEYKRYKSNNTEEFIYTGELKQFVVSKNPLEICFKDKFYTFSLDNNYHQKPFDDLYSYHIENNQEKMYGTDESIVKLYTHTQKVVHKSYTKPIIELIHK